MHPHISWLGEIAGDHKIPNAIARFAMAVAAMADGNGRLRARTAALAAAAQVSSRYVQENVQRLAERGYIKVHASKMGRFDIEIVTPRDEQAPVSGKPYREIAGQVVGVVAKSKTTVAAYVDADTAMVKLTIRAKAPRRSRRRSVSHLPDTIPIEADRYHRQRLVPLSVGSGPRQATPLQFSAVAPPAGLAGHPQLQEPCRARLCRKIGGRPLHCPEQEGDTRRRQAAPPPAC
ncbi:hypothetical protein EET67_23940 [Pseudaminobacter arsenicus]|uniref:Helix-turn-helix domain-containing protein n=1 Tax=Borborobacter arsenicus TaxID=1851146 RepID=A0A432UZK7_9HYPH|nr:hypothetical protein [Pseudaminobacter arsenicus]RUM95331.1 hypothetical protein EET67_23940 [Pseudaminobacter arsenicus]